MATNDGLSIIVAIKFVSLLAKPFNEWTAFQLGLIDDQGNKLRDAETPEEKRCFASWFNLVRNIKRMLVKIPGGKSAMASLIVAFSLLKEGIEREAGEKIGIDEFNGVLETFKFPLYQSPDHMSNTFWTENYRYADRYAITNDLISEIIDCRPVVKYWEVDDVAQVYEPKEKRRFFVCKDDLVRVTK